MTKDFTVPVSAKLICDIINAADTFKDTLSTNTTDQSIRLSDGFRITEVQDWLKDCVPDIKAGRRAFNNPR